MTIVSKNTFGSRDLEKRHDRRTESIVKWDRGREREDELHRPQPLVALQQLLQLLQPQLHQIQQFQPQLFKKIDLKEINLYKKKQ